MPPPVLRRESPLPELPSKLRILRFEGDERALVAALVHGSPLARAALYERYQAPVRRVLARVLGVDQELPDVLQEVFARALADIGKLSQPDRLGAWLTSVAVFTARGHIRARRRRRWLSFWSPDALPQLAVESADTGDEGAALAATYRLLARLPADERIVLALRYIEGMELRQVADASGLSLATVKRRLTRATERFEKLARREPLLAAWGEEREP